MKARIEKTRRDLAAREGVVRLNLGCGSRFHADWLNLDIMPMAPAVIRADLRAGVPLADASCDAVYHCAILEHMRPDEARLLINECRRVLKPGGVLRVGAPDLEAIARIYLAKLDAARAGDRNSENAARERDWMCLELFDQLARERSGGEMLDYLRQKELPHEAFILGRIGEEGRELLDGIRYSGPPNKGSIPARIVRRIRHIAKRHKPGSARAIGEFRLGGEAHQWMYDEVSLAQLLRECGLEVLGRRDAFASDIAQWPRFELDARADGTINKPDCFFMEARA